MILGTIGGILFALGMCMALIPEWNAFRPGVVMGVIGVLVLVVMVLVLEKKWKRKIPSARRERSSEPSFWVLWGALLLGVGMCLTMVWSNMILGIVIGIVGIVVLLCLIPLTKGLK